MARMRRSARARSPSRPFTSANSDGLVGAHPGGAQGTDERAMRERDAREPALDRPSPGSDVAAVRAVTVAPVVDHGRLAECGYFNAFVKNCTNAEWSAASTSGCSE